ncbi:MAG: 4-hydroxybutyryl-CoA dehydratase [Chloroflexi bacterium]|nr:4-hydroxybutyryl-CoA dehydratase [Chloroflexota bacterium]
MRTAQEYVESLHRLKRELYVLGQKVQDFTEHPMLRPSLNALAKTYDIAHDPRRADLFVRQGVDGQPVNCFTSLHHSSQDLVDKVKALRVLGQETGTCFQRCVGWDALNALDSTTFEMDQALGTGYHGRFMEYLRFVQANDLVCNGAMTDVKGDRSLRPSQQPDPDMFLRVVERRPDGIVVRGAKAHQTGAIFSHEIIAMPTLAMRADDRDYAVAFAVPSDARGIIYILGRQASDTRKLEEAAPDVGNPIYGGHEALVIFDDVFVPTERIFMDGEWQFSGALVERFAGYHRQSYGGCKVGVGDVLIGAAAAAAEYAGAGAASHVRRKLAEMIHLNETLYACGIACSAAGQATASGTYLVDLLLANVCKQNVTRFPYEIARLAEDLAGGLLVTMPSIRDLSHPEIGPLLAKYLQGVADVPAADRLRILRLIENLTIGAGAVAYRTESMHGAGSPEAQVIMIGRLSDIEAKKRLARRLAGVISQ